MYQVVKKESNLALVPNGSDDERCALPEPAASQCVPVSHRAESGRLESDADANSHNVATLPILPGQKLRQARLRKGLSVAEVAEALNLSKRVIRAIELDDYESLPGSLYARGYIKNYCRLLGVPSAEIIALFNSLVADDALESEGLDHQRRSFAQYWRSLNIQWHVYALLTAVVFLVAISVWPEPSAEQMGAMMYSEGDVISELNEQLPDEPSLSIGLSLESLKPAEQL